MDINNPKLRVIGARAIILEDKMEKATSSGIIIPGRDKEKTFKGKVLAVGTGAMLDNGVVVPMEVKPGDRVIFQNWSGSPVIVEDEKKGEQETYIIINERDILCIIEE